MDGKTVVQLLERAIAGKPTDIGLGLTNRPTIWGLSSPKFPLTGAKLRSDGLVETQAGSGWDVFDPADVVAVYRSPFVFDDAGRGPQQEPGKRRALPVSH